MAAVLGVLNYPQFDPVIVRLYGLQIRWYGVAYMAGFVLGYMVLRRMVRGGRLRMDQDALADLIGWLVVGVMVGGRGGWWIFYNTTPAKNWYDPIAVWHGGMSFHGGFIGVVLVIILFCWKRKLSFLNTADCLALVTPIGLCLGRIANFINQELVGRVSHLPWAMNFPNYPEPRHPSQLYESFLEGPVLLACLWIIDRMCRPRDGRTAAMFILLYSLIRFLVEFTREPDVQLGFIAFGWLTMGQLLSGCFAVAGIVWWVIISLRVSDDSGATNGQPKIAAATVSPRNSTGSSKKDRHGAGGR